MTARSRPLRTSPPAASLPELPARRLDKGVAQYYRLYELLSAALRDGTFAPDSALPSEPQLCAQHGISRTTVRRALARLEQEGRVIRRRGSGTYACRERTGLRFRLGLHALPGTLAKLESRSTATTLRQSPAPVPAALAAIAAEIGSTACLLEQRRCSQGEPLSLTAAYLPEPLGRRLPDPIPRRVSIMTLLDRLGPRTAAVQYSLAAVAAEAAAARALEVPLGSPLLRVRAVLTDDGGGLRAVMESLCRSDRLQLTLLESERA